MKKRTPLGIGVAVAVLCAYGCASTMYTPRPDGRIAVTSTGATLHYTKNGASVRASMDNLQQLVADNPAAAEHARRAASDFQTGFVLDFGGLAATLAGAFVMAPGTNPDGTGRPVSDGHLAAGSALLVGGLVSIFGAIHYLTSAQSHQLDAINIYNDGVVVWPPPGTPARPPVPSPVPLAPPPRAAPAPAPLPPAPVSPLPPPPPTMVPEAPAPP
ncbi:MAG TPA: hypothetical protein VN853_05560 [Polyangia bacterium]|nr:hypothetical protein [Polyangia bacterium]